MCITGHLCLIFQYNFSYSDRHSHWLPSLANHLIYIKSIPDANFPCGPPTPSICRGTRKWRWVDLRCISWRSQRRGWDGCRGVFSSYHTSGLYKYTRDTLYDLSPQGWFIFTNFIPAAPERFLAELDQILWWDVLGQASSGGIFAKGTICLRKDIPILCRRQNLSSIESHQTPSS